MPTKDPRIDAYIANSADFAKPILNHLRKLVHNACPNVEETLKWNMPAFLHKGILCGMAAFKQHCTFGCWKHELIFPKGSARDGAMGQLGRITARCQTGGPQWRPMDRRPWQREQPRLPAMIATVSQPNVVARRPLR